MKEFSTYNAGTEVPLRIVLKTIFFAGFCVGTLDILAALTDYYIATGKNPVVVLKFIASGFYGKQAFSGGTNMVFLGLLSHFIIAFIFTIFFFSVYPKIKFISKYRIATGIIYGTFAWAVMNLIVLPLSNTPPISHTTFKVIKAILILVVMMGIPLSFIAHNCFYPSSVKWKDRN